MNDMKKNIRRVFWLYFVLFLMIIIYLGKFILIDSHEIINSTYNPRLNRNDFTIKRGSIYDMEGNILAQSQAVDGAFRRFYAGDGEFTHTVGFIHNTKSGTESKFNFNLNNIDIEVFQRIRNLIDDTPLQGSDIRLSLNSDIQMDAVHSLNGIKGGIAMIEPKTGRIIALASSPSFNANDVSEKWSELSSDTENSPLLNRASQGLYPPGSIFKVITADAIMTHLENYENFYYECKGEAYFDGVRIQCFNQTSHGTINLHDAFKYSCNTYFAMAITELGYDKLQQSAEKALFNNDYTFDLERVQSRFSAGETVSAAEIIQTSIGQGKTLVTPLHMAMITAAIANDGIMMQPYICEEISTYWGMTKHAASPKVIARIFTEENTKSIKEMMVQVVQSGTGTSAKISDVTMGGKTGTAQNASGQDHGWFIAFAPAEDPQIAIAIITENSNGPRKALEIARNLISSYLQLYQNANFKKSHFNAL